MNENMYTIPKKRKTAKRFIVAAVVAMLIVIAWAVLSFYTSYLEIAEIGANFTDIFIKNSMTKIAFQLISFIIIFLLFYLSSFFLKKNLLKAGVEHSFIKGRLFFLILCVGVSILASTYVSGTIYEKYLMILHAVPFGLQDPVFFKDVGYYVFQRPFLAATADSLLAILTILVIYTAAIYVLLYVKIGERNLPDLLHHRQIVTHVVVLIIIYLFCLAAATWINAQDILFADFANLTGAGFVDAAVRSWFYKIAPFLLFVIALLALVFLLKRKTVQALCVGFSYLAVLLLVSIICWAVQLFYVSPNEAAIEAPYIQRNIDFTRIGYHLDQVVETEYAISDTVDQAALDQSKNTINNIRIIDFPATVTATNQLQGIRSYYYFNNLHVGLYHVAGQKQAVAIGPREIAKGNLDNSAKNYINEKFRFTHGYGVAMVALNAVTDQGHPQFFIKDLLQEKTEGVPYVVQPRIYFGELTKDQVVVNTLTRELDYSEGTKDEEFDYDGTAGIRLSPLHKLLFAVKTGDFRMLFASQITSESRLLLNRNILERVKTVAPFFKYDPNPTIVIDDDGTLKWVIDGYTYTDQLPYSQRTDDYNYIRNSFKVVVDAYNGSVKFYVIDSDDPILKVFSQIYPTLFEQEEMPQSVFSKTKYPEWLFSQQCAIYAKYHTVNPKAFYNKNDMYAVANEKYEDEIRPIEPYYNIMQLDELDPSDAQLALMLPFTLVNRENMVSWIAVGCEGDNYGKMIAYKFPKDINIYGPLQIENLIDNDPEISKEMTLWNAGGSSVIRGNLLVIPLKNTILYIEPVYLSSKNQASLPALKRVIAAYGDTVVMEENLSLALSKVFNANITVDVQAEEPQEVIQPEQHDTAYYFDQILSAYQQVEKSAKNGDWTAFGTSLESLKSAITAFQEALGVAETEPASSDSENIAQ